MKLAFGFYRHMLDREHYRFARQCGATHAVIHLVDYQASSEASTRDDQPLGDRGGWGRAGSTGGQWTVEHLRALKRDLFEEGLALEAIENFDPADWYDVLLDGPKAEAQLQRLQEIVRNVGEAGIPVLGYNFSIAGVASRVHGTYARGGADTAGMNGVDDAPLPNGMVWNMVVDPNAQGELPTIDHETLWGRYERFLRSLVPVAEEAGVRLALHPDDPPAPYVRRQPRLVYRPELFQRAVDTVKSPANCLEFCLGTLSEMDSELDVYEIIRRHAEHGDIAYVHFRNVRGKVPDYQEVFLDEGDLDMARVVRILKEAGFDGVLTPDHTPKMTCDAPWHAGMAYAMGYMNALLQVFGRPAKGSGT